MKARFTAAALLALCLSEPASAHLVSTRFGEFYNGMLHPLMTLQHVVPWLGLGLVGGLLGSATSKWIVPAFPVAVGAGALLAAILPETAIVNWFNILSFVLLGVLAALALQLRQPVFLGLALVVGFSHGVANGTSELSGGSLILYVAGVTVAAYGLITIATAVATALVGRAAWGRIALRSAGSWIVAVGLVFGGYTLQI